MVQMEKLRCIIDFISNYNYLHLLKTRKAALYIISVVSVCLSVCLYLSDNNCRQPWHRHSFLHIWNISRGYGSSLCIKVIGLAVQAINQSILKVLTQRRGQHCTD